MLAGGSSQLCMLGSCCAATYLCGVVLTRVQPKVCAAGHKQHEQRGQPMPARKRSSGLAQTAGRSRLRCCRTSSPDVHCIAAVQVDGCLVIGLGSCHIIIEAAHMPLLACRQGGVCARRLLVSCTDCCYAMPRQILFWCAAAAEVGAGKEGTSPTQSPAQPGAPEK